MGLLDLVFPGNPVSPWLGENRNRLTDSFAGMIGHGNDPRAILQGAVGGLQHGRSADEENAIIQEERKQQEAALAQEAQQQSYTRQKLAEWGYTDLIDAMDGGGMTAPAVWGEALKRKSPAAGGEAFTLGEGQVRYGPNGEVIASGPAKPNDPTTDIQNYEYYRDAEMSAGRQPLSMFEWQQAKAKAGATSIDLNANQGAAALYADRMAAANAVLEDPALVKAMTNIIEQGKAQIPVAGNFVVSKEFQMAEQAQRDFVNAVLRRESGAVISPSEFDNAKKQYFPQPGDTPEVIEQKRRNRLNAINGIARAAGPNYALPGGSSDIDSILSGYGL